MLKIKNLNDKRTAMIGRDWRKRPLSSVRANHQETLIDEMLRERAAVLARAGFAVEDALAKLENHEEFRQHTPWQGSRNAPVPTGCRTPHDCAQIVFERALEAELSDDHSLGLVLRTLAQRMMRPSEP